MNNIIHCIEKALAECCRHQVDWADDQYRVLLAAKAEIEQLQHQLAEDYLASKDEIERLQGDRDSETRWAGAYHQKLIAAEAENERLTQQRDECRKLLLEVVGECVQQHSGWFVATLDDEWLAAARAAGGE